MRKLFTSTLFALTLTACENGQYRDNAMPPSPMMEDARMAPQAGYAEADADMAPRPGGNPAKQPSVQSYLAYRYNYGFSLPAKAVAPTAKSHAAMCQKAGPALCQILSSNTSSQNSDYVNASLQLRAEPEWLKQFTAEIQTSVSEAKGEMTHSGVSAEDLTRSILDTDARLKAQKTLRTRLERLLETRDAKLPDLLALERELARVQGQIESATTTLNVLKKRVSMSIVEIHYQTQSVAVSRSALSPISRSLKNFAGNIATGVGAVIEFASFVLPWLLLVILPGLWLIRRLWRQRRAAVKNP